MKKRTAIIGALVSLLPLGQPLVIGGSAALTSAVVMLAAPEKARAESADFYYKRGYEKSNKGDFYGAISDYNKALKINPSYTLIYGNIGYVKNELKDYLGAISDFNKVLIEYPDDSFAYYNRARSKYFLKDYYSSISDYNKVIEIDPNNPRISDAYYNRGFAKKKIRDLKGACSDLKKASSLGADDIPKWVKEDC